MRAIPNIHTGCRSPTLIYAFGKCLYFMTSNAVKWDCGSIFVHYLHQASFPNTFRYLDQLFRVNNMIHKYDKNNLVNLGKLHRFSEQLRMFDPLYTKCEKGWILVKTKAQSINYHQSSALMLRNTFRHS